MTLLKVSLKNNPKMTPRMSVNNDNSIKIILAKKLKDDTSLSVIESINQRWRFLEALILTKTYNDRGEENALEKHHLIIFLTLKKCH